MNVEVSIVADTTAATTGVAYSTKNRCHLSTQSAAGALSEADCDGFWIDGSDTPEGRELPFSLADRLPALREIHRGVDGGADRAIIYGLTYLLARGYKYCALVENDVVVDPGWLPVAIEAMQRATADGLRVGAATVRTYDRRIMFVRPGYAVMFNTGAGMIVLTREAAQAVVTTFRSTNGREVNRVCRKMTGGDIGQICERGVNETHWLPPDWFFDLTLMQMGFASVGALPSIARNIDADMSKLLGVRPVSEAQPAAGLDPSLFRNYHRNLTCLTQTADSLGYLFDPQLDRFVLFPHQLPAAAYAGEWKTNWQACFGPFEALPTDTGDTLRWPLMNGSCDVLFRTTKDNTHARITAGGSAKDHFLAGGANLAIQVPGVPGETLPMEVQLDPGAAVIALLFTDPQPWFRGLTDWRGRLERLNLIKPLTTTADAPSIVGDGNPSLPHLVDHRQ